LKYLIVGIGNVGSEYHHTRHNIGFDVLDALAKASNICFQDNRYGSIAEYKFKGRTFILLKPSTYVNLSGKAVNYWLQKENIPIENLLVILDDIALPLGFIRLRSKGSDGGHNGLKNINEVLGRNDYARLRFGIGNEFPKGYQVDYVLGNWNDEENKQLEDRIPVVFEIVKSFALAGVQRTMSQYNNK
jgi:peptidyl-tRNA hydrolase, PTH1 family